MIDASALSDLFSVAGAAWAGFIVFFAAVVRIWNGLPAVGETWILWQQTKAAQKASDYHRRGDEIKRLSDRCVRLEEQGEREREQCRKDYAELHRQFMELSTEVAFLRREVAAREGYQIGRGEAAQEVTILESTKRLSSDKKPPEGK